MDGLQTANIRSSRWVRILTSLAIGAGSLALVAESNPARAAADPAVYVDSLGVNWANWSWGSNVNTDSTSPVRSGSRAIAAQVTAQWGAVSLRTSDPIVMTPTTSITFWIHGGSTGASLQFFTGPDDNFTTVSPGIAINAPANSWSQHTITGAQLGSPATVARMAFGGLNGTTTGSFSIDDVSVTATQPPGGGPVDGTVRIDATRTRPFPARLRGSNISLYSQTSGFANQTLRNRASGVVPFLRFPGGQDSQQVGWASCEARVDYPGAIGCARFNYTARSSDFIGLARSVGAEGLVSVNANATAKENAAYVAFMNGQVGDTRLIGVDQKGADWRTVGYWAQQRANAGYAQPLGVTYWEFGNETFGGLPAGGAKCSPYGWEVTFTCDATDFVNGIGIGAARYDGYLATRNAMRAVDPSVQVGLPAVDPREGFNNWTPELLTAAGQVVDFLLVHHYYYWIPPANDAAGNATILAQPQAQLPGVQQRFYAAMDSFAGGRRIPMLVTEYNLTPGPQNDPAARLNTVLNAMLEGEVPGMLGTLGGFVGANQFDMYGSTQANNSNFGLMRNDGAVTRTPQYWAWVLWSMFGDTLVDVTSSFNASSDVSVYAGRTASGEVSLLAFNKTSTSKRIGITVDGVSGLQTLRVDTANGGSLLATSMTFNGVANPLDNRSDAPPQTVNLGGNRTVDWTVPAASIVLFRAAVGGTSPITTTVPPATTAVPVTSTRPPTTTTTPATTTTVLPTSTTTRPATTTTRPPTTTTLAPTTTTLAPTSTTFASTTTFAPTTTAVSTTTRVPTTTTAVPTTTTVPVTTTIPVTTTRPATTTTVITTTSLPPTTTTTTAAPTTTTTRPPTPACRTRYRTEWDNGAGLGVSVLITNDGPPINGWTVTFDVSSGYTIDGYYGASITQSGTFVSGRSVGYNDAIPTGGTAFFGYNAGFSGARVVPVFRVNGTVCTPTT